MRRPIAVVVVLVAAVLGAVALAHGQSATDYRVDTLTAGLDAPSDVAPLPTGGYVVADTANNRVVRVDAAGTVTVLASELNGPRGVAVLPGGGYLVADTANNVIRRVGTDGSVTVVAGGAAGASAGTGGFGGDGGPATRALLNGPQGVAALPDGSFLIADTANNRIRRVDAAGVITTVAGDGSTAQLNAPARVVPLSGGGFLIADTANNRIRRVDTAGVLSTVAGTTGLTAPQGVAVRSDGSLVIADTGAGQIRELGGDGTLRTIATGLAGPRAVALAPAGILVADTSANRIAGLTPVAPTTTTATTPTTTTPLPEPPVAPPPGVAPPRVGSSAVVAPVRGVVRIRRAGHRGFTTLTEATNVGVGTELDTTHGAVALFFQTSASTGSSAIASLGRFVVLQPRRPVVSGQRPGLLVLSQPLNGCPRAARGSARTAAARTSKRKVKVRAKGKVRTKGKYISAIVLGTEWTTIDRCRSSTERTTKGVVQVRDFVKHKTVRVPAGRSYTARARR
jgi:sugar lactone lactonase YvrE